MSCCKSQKKMDKLNLGGWSFEPELYYFLRENLADDSTILELGSGHGTSVLAKHYKMFSIEHNIRFVNKYDSTYVHAPLINGWYDIKIVKEFLQNLKYDCILVDGPPGDLSNGRIGFFDNLNLFNTDVMIVIDDTNRSKELQLVNDVYNSIVNNSDRIVTIESFKTFSVIHSKL